MISKKTAWRIVIFLCTAAILGLLFVAKTPAQAASEPRLKHSVCQAQCVLDTNILHSGMGDTTAKYAYEGWYSSFFIHTGCSDTAVKTIVEFTLAVIGELAGSPGGYTMQCWQELMAQAYLCSEDCSDYFISDAKYGPNVDVELDYAEPGSLSVELRNTDQGYLPEEKPNGYSLQFNLRTTLQLEDGTALIVDNTLMPSMSYANWVTRGGLDDCIYANGADDELCKVIEAFDMENVVFQSVEFLDGVMYDLSSYVIDSDGMGGSFSDNGFVELFSDGDSVTIEQGPYSGFYWTRIHGSSDIVTSWDASFGEVTIENHECNTWWCGLTGDRVNADTYVFALQGPEELRLEGTYTVEVTADLVHDKDFSNNTVSYSYTDLDVGSILDDGGDDDEDGEEYSGVTLDQITVVNLPGPGEYFNNVSSNMPGAMYRLDVPDDVNYLYFRLHSMDGGIFNYYVRHGALPLPNYPDMSSGYDCRGEATSSHSYGCPFSTPYHGAYYIFIPKSTSGVAIKLEVIWVTDGDIATRNAQEIELATQQAQQTQTPEEEETEEVEETQEAEDGDGGKDQTLLTYTEVEPNNSKATANTWDMASAFTGQNDQWGDMDYVAVSFDFSGIYTFTLSGYSSSTHGTLFLIRSPSGGYLDSTGETSVPASLTFDASAGEQYYFVIDAYSIDEVGSDYALEMTGFIADTDESNDDRDNATFWDITQGDKSGYFFDKTTGRYDYIEFIAPETQEGTEITFTVTNPGEDIQICLKLLNYRGYFMEGDSCTAAGEPASLAFVLEAGQEYYLKMDTVGRLTSTSPYTISVDYQPAEAEEEVDDLTETYTFRGKVYESWGLIDLPISNVEVYVQVNGQPAFLFDTTNLVGNYKGGLDLHEGDAVRVWVVKEGCIFFPEEAFFYVDPGDTVYINEFEMLGGELIQDTPTPGPEQTGTEPPPPIQTGLAMTVTPVLETTTLTPTSTLSPQPTATLTPSPTPVIDYANATIFTGTIWRLFDDTGPVGVAAADVILSVNGVDQAAASSMIDGTYLITLEGIQPGDILRIRAEGAEDTFEPIYYEWQAEAGVDKWDYEFYSYWDEITPPAQDDQNRIYGWVLDGMMQGIPDVYLNVMVGSSDAIQRIGPTDANGYYDGMVTLPSRVMVTIWVDGEGFLPSRLQFFHAYYLEDRQIMFGQESAGMQ